ncbi:MAG: hypothetical protein KDB68_15780 [Planctomycetes bacterium]|nr:hypothetical protein [Planctomycetota bacterium]
MTRLRLIAIALFVTCAGALAAQQAAPGPGDLIPRTGTIAYMTSDHPDALYRLFGHDEKGGWKLRSWAQRMMKKSHEKDPESEEAARDQQIFDWVFGSYEAVERVEIGLVDVTLDGPKYLVHLKTRKGDAISPTPEFLKEFLTETKEFQGIKYHLYRVPENDKNGEYKDEEEGVREPGDGREEEPRNALGDKRYGMDRYYVASTPSGLLVANFESTIRDAIEKLSTGNYKESLSGREEFATWLKERKPHDLSIFVIGREIQSAIERLLPSEDQAGVDAEGIYNGVDKWMQFREYKYVVFDLDYEDAARGITVAASFKTRRQTRLLEKLAIEPAEFKMLKYVPEGSILTAGFQLGDAKTTFENLKELSFDVEDWAREIEEGMNKGRSVPPDMPPEMPPEEGTEKSILPGDFSKGFQRGDVKSERDPDTDDEVDDSKVEEALEELEKMLQEYGTSTDDVLGALGSEVVAFALPNVERARERARGNASYGTLMQTADLGIVINIKDVEKAKAIIVNAREKDPEGAFRGFTDVGYQGQTFHVSSEHPYGYAFTDDALLIVVALGITDADATQPVIAGLKAMTDSAGRTVTGDSSFVKNGSKFIEADFGAMSRLTNVLNEDLSKRLDRYASPQLQADPTSFITDMTIALRFKEYKDGVEMAIRVAGLPDFGEFLDGEGSVFGGPNANRDGYNYSQDNLRTLSNALHRRVEAGEALELESMIAADEIRVGVLQVPFDAQWKGDMAKIGWASLDQITRDAEGNLPEWVDAVAAEMIEENEAAGFSSLKLADGDLKAWLTDYKTGFIVAYQEKADTLGGHVVLYADGQAGWLAAEALTEALALNAKGEPVPAEDNWNDWDDEGWEDGPKEPRRPKGVGPRLPDDDPWVPGSGN